MEMAEKILHGDEATASRLITLVENGSEEAIDALKILFPHTGKAYVVGITGAPGAGKSTLICEIIGEFRKRDQTVGVIAVDATNPFSGGAVLGDRVRMGKHHMDPGVFIRSMATRGNLGGLARATREATYILDALGKDVIIVETVGVGQDEVDIFKTTHTTVVVLTPGMGDDVQAMKAGILEIGDIFVVNKADHDGVDKTVREIEAMLNLRSKNGKKGWQPEVFKTVAVEAQGIEELAGGLERHRKYLKENDRRGIREKQYYETELLKLLNERVTGRILNRIGGKKDLTKYVERIIHKEIDPYSVADMLLERIGL
jgi:LAO/AO transport system kinase